AGKERAIECYKHALALNPYLRGAQYGLAMSVRGEAGGIEKARKLLQEHEDFKEAFWHDPTDFKYTEAGRYCLAIGQAAECSFAGNALLPLFARNGQFQVRLADGARWATADDFGKGPLADLRRAIRKRFGAVLVVLDYNGDGKADLFLLAAVVEN